MGRPGVIAFPVLLLLGAITGYLAYDMLVVKATPVEGIYDGSPYRKDLAGAQSTPAPVENSTQEQPTEEAPAVEEETPAAEETPSTEETPVEEQTESSVVTISILKGSSGQGAPDYGPDAATASLADTIKWVNDDTLLHTATSGTGFDDPEFKAAFDTGFLAPNKDYSIAAADIGVGEYTYFCQAHPFMVGTLTIE